MMQIKTHILRLIQNLNVRCVQTKIWQEIQNLNVRCVQMSMERIHLTVLLQNGHYRQKIVLSNEKSWQILDLYCCFLTMLIISNVHVQM